MEHLPAFILFAAIAAITPGPNNIMIMSSGVNFGVRASLPHLLGICFGVPILMVALGFGAGALFERFVWLHETIKIVGITYLLYLAYRIAHSAPDAVETTRAKPLSFVEAALFQLVNPKTWIMGTSAIATYTTVGIDMTPQVLSVGLVFFVLAWPSAGIWLVFGVGLNKLLKKPLHRRLFNWSMAILLLLSMYSVIAELGVRYLL